jgi:hypothetical protein
MPELRGMEQGGLGQERKFAITSTVRDGGSQHVAPLWPWFPKQMTGNVDKGERSMPFVAVSKSASTKISTVSSRA